MYGIICTALLLTSTLRAQLADPAVIFTRGKERLLEDLKQLPRYTCVETVRRQYYAPPFHWQSPKSCQDVIGEHDRRTHELKMTGWDRLRLDVAVSGSHEIYSWVGAPRFEEDTLAQVAGEGPLGSGDFGPFITAIFTVANVKFQDEQILKGRRVLEYAYDVPERVSKYQVNFNRKNWFITAYSGTFLLDRDDPDLLRLMVRTADLRPETGKCQAISEVEYGRVLIRGHPVLIPRETSLRLIGRKGEEVLNLTSYARCREYASTSVLRFEAAEPADSNPSKPLPPPRQSPFPAGLRFDWRLMTAIDSDTAAAGDPIEAVLRSEIRGKKGEVLAPAGTHVHGRLVRLANHSDGYFDVAMKLESIDIKGTTVPFNAVLQSQVRVLYRPRPSEHTVGFSGAAQFFFKTDHLKLIHLDATGATGPMR